MSGPQGSRPTEEGEFEDGPALQIHEKNMVHGASAGHKRASGEDAQRHGQAESLPCTTTKQRRADEGVCRARIAENYPHKKPPRKFAGVTRSLGVTSDILGDQFNSKVNTLLIQHFTGRPF